jgi:hypothetical protein
MDLPSRSQVRAADRIATGGMPEVFLARIFALRASRSALVIKRILPDLAQSPRLDVHPRGEDQRA